MENIEANQLPKRPTFLVVLSVFSLISIVGGLLSSVFGLISGPIPGEQIEEVIASNMDSINQLNEMGQPYWAEIMLKIVNLITYTNNNFYVDRLINLGAYGIGLAGIMFMLRGRKLGFHLYIVYNLITLVGVYASAPIDAVPSFYIIVSAIFSLIFIVLYSLNLKFMK